MTVKQITWKIFSSSLFKLLDITYKILILIILLLLIFYFFIFLLGFLYRYIFRRLNLRHYIEILFFSIFKQSQLFMSKANNIYNMTIVYSEK